MSSQQVIKLNLNNNLGEFTRRKNWSSNILDSLRDVVHVANSDLSLVYCSAASSEFLGYRPDELMGRSFAEYIHVDDVDMFVREFRAAESMSRTLCCQYRFLRKDGKYTTLETRGRFYKQAFFGSARRIPTEATHSMDSFLGLKVENKMLRQQLLALKKLNEEHTDDTSTSRVYTQGVSSSHDLNESVSMLTGLHYDLGERSIGISMGLENGELTTVSAIKKRPSTISETKKNNTNKKIKKGRERKTE
ncbi:PAS domain-containing protein, partial [Blakeslea trispora]